MTADTSKPEIQWGPFFARAAASLIILLLLLFVPAGTIAWTRGWLFFVVVTALGAVSVLVARRLNPEIFAARSRIQPGTKRWDRILLIFLFAAMLAIVPVAALDDARFHWSAMSWWAVGMGYALLVMGMGLTLWCQVVNRFFEPGVRIQTDRGHTVIDTGPYAVIRHPGYLGAWMLFAGMALALGSWWALVPAAIAAFILVIRIVWEDRTLQAELNGYAAYAKRVRFRLIPGIW